MFLRLSCYLTCFFSCIILNVMAAPVVTSVSPTNGGIAGGNVVMINGSGFSGATAVDFGPRPAASFIVITDTLISATVPAGSPGTVDVLVTASGQSPPSPSDFYTYTTVGWQGIISSSIVGPDAVILFSTATNTFNVSIPGADASIAAVPTPNGVFIYTANTSPAGFSVIDVATDTLILTVPTSVGDGAFDIIVNPSGTRIYISNNTSGYVTVVDTSTNTVVTDIFIEPNIGPLSITPDGATVYVGGFTSGSVIPIDTATNTVGTAIVTGGFPGKIYINSDGEKAFIPVFFSSEVLVMDVSTQMITNSILLPPGSGPYGSSLLPNGTKLYVANIALNTLSVIDVTSETLMTTITLPNPPAGTFWAAATPDSATVYVISDTDNLVIPVDTQTDTVGPLFSGGMPGFVDLTISPDPAPVAAFTITPNFAGSPSIFDASMSLSPIGTIASYAWDFGDSVTAITASPFINHTYAHPGSYTVTLTVTNSAGTSTTQVFSSGFMSNNGGPIATLSQGLQSPQAPPTGLRGSQTACRYPSQTDYVNVLTWRAPLSGAAPAYYEISRNSLAHLIGTVPGRDPLVFRDHNRKKNTKYTYYVVAVDSSGIRSAPEIIVVNPNH